MTNSRYDTGRLLTNPNAADARTYAVRTVTDEITLFTFRTGGVNGKTSDETAIGNLFDASEHYEQSLGVWRLYDGELLATAQSGIGQDHRAVPQSPAERTAEFRQLQAEVWPADDEDRKGFGR